MKIESLKTEQAWKMILLAGLGFIVFNSLCCTAAESAAIKTRTGNSFHVGYRILDLKYPGSGKGTTLTVAVWYPTSEVPKPYNYGGPTNGNVALNAKPCTEGGPYPLLVFSHGYGGSGLSAAFLTEPLAARGWIVAAPDHHDRYPAVRIRTGHNRHFDRRGFWLHAREISKSGPGDRGAYIYRFKEMKLVLDRLLASGLFKKLINRERIAVGGHSFGGFTVLGLCGTIKQRYDDRIKGLLLFSTGAGGYLFRESELAAVKIPSIYFLGEREKGQSRGTKTMAELAEKVYRNFSPPKYFLEIKGANHFSFNNRFIDNRRLRRLSGSDEQFEVIRRYSIAFLEKYIAGKKDTESVLKQQDSLLTRYLREPAINVKRD